MSALEKIELKKIKGGWAFYRGDEEILLLSQEDYFSLRLYEIDSFTEKEFINIKYRIDYKSAKRIALESNIYKNKSAKELIAKLCQKSINEDIATCVVEEMTDCKEIDEKEIIRRFINDRVKFNPRSKRFLKYELLKKGFKDADIELIIEELNLCDYDLANNLVSKKKRSLKTPQDIIKFLRNKGFDYHTIKKVTGIINEDMD